MSVPLKRLAMVIAGQSPASDDVSELGKGLPFIQGNAEFGARTPTPKWQCDVAPKVALPGDVLVSVRAPVGATNVATASLGIGRGVAAIRAWRADPGYLYWFVSSSSDLLNAEATGSTFTAVTAADLASLDVPVTDAEEQRRIADYLDRETATIDALIKKQRQLVTGLRTRRQIAVEVAFANFLAIPLKAVLDVAQTGPFGTQLSAQDYVPNGIPVINPSHIRNGCIAPDPTVGVSRETAQRLQRHLLREGDVVLGRKGDVDKSALIGRGEPQYLLGSDSMMLRALSASLESRYLWWWLQSPGLHAELRRLAVGTTVAGLNQQILASLRIPLPSLDEQRAIADHLDRETAKIDTLIAKAERFIELAQERRAALITAAVTGQIEIPAEEPAA